MDGAEERGVFLAAPQSFTAGGDTMVRVQRTDEARAMVYPLYKALFLLLVLGRSRLGKGAGLVGNLPSIDGSRLRVGAMGIAIGAGEQETQMVVEELLCIGHGDELLGILLVGVPSIDGGNRHIDACCPRHILRIAS